MNAFRDAMYTLLAQLAAGALGAFLVFVIYVAIGGR